MNKLTYLLLFLILGLLVAIGGTVYVKNKQSTPVVTAPVYTDFSVTLSGTSDTKVIVPNFLKDASVTEDAQNHGLYFVGHTSAATTSAGSPLYDITYEKQSGYFNIALLAKPLSTARTSAEAYLKNLLKVDETNLCGLSYTVSVPEYVDTDAAGVDYRFSFCPDSIKLPQ